MGTVKANPAEMAIIAQAHQRQESWLEMRLVESFCVTPVMPQKTRAIVAKSSHAGINDIGVAYMLRR
jgi:hypothetical protein